MLVVSSSDFLKEFTVYANQTHDKQETIVVQRSNSKNLVVMSLEQFNEMQKALFMAKNGEESQK